MITTAGHIVRLSMKELISLFYDPVMMIFVVYAMTLQVYLVAKDMALEVRHARVAVVDEDHSRLSARIVDALRPPYFHEPEPISLDEIDDALDGGQYVFVIDFPRDFEADVISNRSPQIALYVDATAISQAFVGASFIRRIVAEETALIQGIALPGEGEVFEPTIRVRYNPNRISSWFTGLAELLMIITLFAIVLPGVALMREREQGTVEHLLVMPLRPAEVMLAKMFAGSLVVIIGLAICLGFVIHLALGVEVRGSLGLLFAGTAIFLMSTSALGVAIATFTKTIPQFVLLAMLIMIPMMFLSGAWTPAEAMPPVLQKLMVISPLGYYVEFANALIFRGADLMTQWRPLAAMAAIGAVVFAVSLARFRVSFR